MKAKDFMPDRENNIFPAHRRNVWQVLLFYEMGIESVEIFKVLTKSAKFVNIS